MAGMAGMALFVLGVVAHLGVCARASRWGGRPVWLVAPILAIAAFASSERLVAQKALASLVMPAGLSWLACLAFASAALTAWSRRRTRRQRRIAIAALALLLGFWLSTNNFVASAVMARLERDFARAPVLDEPLDAVLLLGGGAARTPAGRAELTASGDRLATAARLWHQRAARRIICSGSDFRDVRDASQLGADTATLLEAMGVPAIDLVGLPGPRNTSEEMAAAATLIRREGWRRVGVVTSAWHMRRAIALAHRAGLELMPIAADHHAGDSPADLLAAIPSANALFNLQLAAWELLGAAVGR